MQSDLFQFQQSPVNGRRVRQARELRGLTQGALADLLGIDQTMVAHMERGTRHPSAELLDALASELRFPASFFRQPSPPELQTGSLLFRSKSGVGRRVVSQAHAQAGLAFEIALAAASRASLVPVKLCCGNDPIETAQQARSQMRRQTGPIDRFVYEVERLGVLVIPLPELQDLEAFAVWGGPEQAYPVIGMVVGREPDRTRMSLAHELGHLVLHRQLSSGTREMEMEAYRFAAELLMPARDISADFGSQKINLFRLAKLKQKWNVSMQALARRARDLHAISDRQYLYLMKQMSIRGWRTKEPVWKEREVEKPRALRKLIEVAFGRSASTKQIAKGFNLSEDFVGALLQMCSPGPSQESVKRNQGDGLVVPFCKPRRNAGF
jgi:Zn-dependent peptidase ImmA (M78 family)/transcriptional regulator with XRE-family HTH domain